MRVRVDMPRCVADAQCVFTASQAFALNDEDELVYDPAPDDDLWPDVEQAARACPVQAIVLDEA